MNIALVSFDQQWENKVANKAVCLHTMETAARNNADLIVFPEMTLTGFSMNAKKKCRKAQ